MVKTHEENLPKQLNNIEREKEKSAGTHNRLLNFKKKYGFYLI